MLALQTMAAPANIPPIIPTKCTNTDSPGGTHLTFLLRNAIADDMVFFLHFNIFTLSFAAS